ncbi:hypothetical protein A2U01_0094440, partial [Trifolium medium]|nr:hypothetical protein [Trifolium medium]
AQRAYQRARSLVVAEARDFQVPDDFGRFLSLKRGTFRIVVATCRFLSPSELDRIAFFLFWISNGSRGSNML